MPLFSIIIPAYNTENFIRECLESVSLQTFNNWECIIIDDGSTDNTLSIIKEFGNKDSRFKILCQQNSGPVVAREKGISQAKGEYLVFVDSDDRLVPYALEQLNQCIIKANNDIIFFNIFRDFDNYIEKVSIPYKKSNLELLKQIILGDVPGWLHSKVIRKQFWLNCKINTLPECYVMEDVLITTQLLLNNPKYQIINDYLYIYTRTNHDSLTGKSNAFKIIKAGTDNILKIGEVLKQYNYYEKLKLEYGIRLMALKIYYLNIRNLKEGQKIESWVHKNLKYYSNYKGIKKYIYWVLFNLGPLSAHFLSGNKSK